MSTNNDDENIRLVQYLCPQRHAVLAVAYPPEMSRAEAEQTLLEMMQSNHFNPWCGLCGSRDLHFEHSSTQFRSIEAALPTLRAVERENEIARARLRASNN